MKSTVNPIKKNNPANTPDTVVRRKLIGSLKTYFEKNDQTTKNIPHPNNKSELHPNFAPV